MENKESINSKETPKTSKVLHENTSVKSSNVHMKKSFLHKNKKTISNENELNRKEKEKKRILWRKSSWKKREVSRFQFKLLEVKRVIKVTKGGRRFRFMAVAVCGDKKGLVGFGTGKANEVVVARQKAFFQAEKNIMKVKMHRDSIAHNVIGKFCGSRVLLMPSGKGTGIILGGAARIVVQLAGIKNIRGKSFRSNNKLNLIQATFEALKKLKSPQEVKALRDLEYDPIIGRNQLSGENIKNEQN